MSKKKKSVSDLLPLMKNYCKIVEDGLHERWSKWNIPAWYSTITSLASNTPRRHFLRQILTSYFTS